MFGRFNAPKETSDRADLSALECVRETMRLALEELGARLAQSERTDFWALFWERRGEIG
jgi:hypothetical protein